MVVNGVRDRYRVDLIGLQAACEANYARLMRLLPEMREQPGPRQIAVTQGDQMLGVLTLEVILDCPYTSTLRVSQQHSLPWLPVPQLQVQVYHDARMAEVVAAEHARVFAVSTRTPTWPCTSLTKKPSSMCFWVSGSAIAWPVAMNTQKCASLEEKPPRESRLAECIHADHRRPGAAGAAL
jgi:uncharacterized protein